MNNFCLLCGNKLFQQIIEGRDREVCHQCGWIKYDQLKVTAGVLVEKNNKILLVKRAIQPWKGYWYLPAGFVENDESPRDAAEREGFEETNLKIKTQNLIDLYFYKDDPRGNGLLILYSGVIQSGKAKPNSEAQEIGFFSQDEIKSFNLTGGSHNLAIMEWVSGKRKSNLR